MAEAKRRGKRHIDVVIVGGGIMGCATAWELARKGLSVTVLERSVPGAEASSAAAGIVGAQAEAHGAGPMTTLSLLGRSRYPRWEKALTPAPASTSATAAAASCASASTARSVDSCLRLRAGRSGRSSVSRGWEPAHSTHSSPGSGRASRAA